MFNLIRISRITLSNHHLSPHQNSEALLLLFFLLECISRLCHRLLFHFFAFPCRAVSASLLKLSLSRQVIPSFFHMSSFPLFVLLLPRRGFECLITAARIRHACDADFHSVHMLQEQLRGRLKIEIKVGVVIHLMRSLTGCRFYVERLAM